MIARRPSRKPGSWRALLAAVLVTVVPACGDGGGTVTTGGGGATSAPPSAVDPGVGAGSDFCDQMTAQEDLGTGIDVFDPSAARDAFTASLQALRVAQSVAPAALRADMVILVEHAEAVVDLLERHDFDLTAVPAADFEAITTEQVLAATARISEFCGLDDDAAGASDDAPMDREVAFAALMPPGGSMAGSPAEHMRLFVTDSPFAEVLDFYRALVGDELSLTGADGGFQIATFIAGPSSPGGQASITVSAGPGTSVDVVVALEP